MRYLGYFRDVTDDEILYTVEIITENNVDETEEITLTADPVVISAVGDENNIYKPYRCSNATISMLLEHRKFDLNNAFPNNVKVNIYREEELIWTGYSTPNAYKQGYEYFYDTFQLECQDALSILKYYKFKRDDNGIQKVDLPTEDDPYKGDWDKPVITHTKANNLLHIVFNMMEYINVPYDTIYVTDAIKCAGAEDISILDAIFISENNFIDEDGEPMQCMEVLEEICRYTGLTAVPYKNDLYFINTDAIANEDNTYFKYIYGSDHKWYRAGKEEKRDSHNITIDDFNREGTTITLTNVYNKVKVKSDLYPIDKPIPDIYNDNGKLIPTVVTDTANDIPTISKNVENQWVYGDVSGWTAIFKSVSGACIHRTQMSAFTGNLSDVELERNWVYTRYFGFDHYTNHDSKVVLYRHYPDDLDFKYFTVDQVMNHDGTTWIGVDAYPNNEIGKPANGNYTYTASKNYIGAMIFQHGECKVDNWYVKGTTTPQYTTSLLLHQNPISAHSKLMAGGQEFKNYQVTEHKVFAKRVTDMSQKMVEITTDYIPIPTNGYLKLNGKFTYYPGGHVMLPVNAINDNYSPKANKPEYTLVQNDLDWYNPKVKPSLACVCMSIQIGDLYWQENDYTEADTEDMLFTINGEWKRIPDAEYDELGNVVVKSGYDDPYRTRTNIYYQVKEDDRCYCQPYELRNQINGDTSVDPSGFNIPLPRTNDMDINLEKIRITIFRQHAPAPFNGIETPPSYTNMVANMVLIDDFKIEIYNKAERQMLFDMDFIDDDTEYENIIEKDGVEEYPDITNKICTNVPKRAIWSNTFYIHAPKALQTFDDRKRGYSYVNDTDTYEGINITSELTDMTKHNMRYNNVRLLYNKSKSYIQRPEQMLISNISEQYDTPTLVVNLNANYDLDIKPWTLLTYNTQFPDYIFVPDSTEINLEQNMINVNMINKKTKYEGD